MRPIWVVILERPVRAVERALAKLRISYVTVIQGSGGHVAIVSYEPGSCDGDDIAKSLSTQGLAYSMVCDDEYPRSTQVYKRGKRVGDLFVSVDGIARVLGCKVPGLDQTKSRRKIDLTPQNPPPRRPKEWTFGGRTVGEWRHLMKEFEWSVMLEGLVSAANAEALLASLSHPDASVRLLCCKLASAAGIHELRGHAPPIAARLLAVADTDPDRAVRKEARANGTELLEAIDREAIRKRHPWILNFSPKHCNEALGLLDDPDPKLHGQLYIWFSQPWGLTKAQRAAALKKLLAHRKAGVDGPEWRTYFLDQAIDRLRKPEACQGI